MDGAIRSEFQRRAGDRCEYCRIPQAALPFIPFHVEHIVAKQHLVDDSIGNLALACHRCNAYKGPNLSSIDPATRQITALFHPRNDRWTEHFRLQSPEIVPLTATGRVTVRLLCFNDRYRLELREVWPIESPDAQ